MQFLPCAWGPGVATTRSERCESNTRPALETLPSAFLCVSLLSHSFLLALWLPAVLPSLLRSLAPCSFLLCFSFLFCFRGTPSRSRGPPWKTQAGNDEHRQLLGMFSAHRSHSFIQSRRKFGLQKQATLHHFYQKIK